MLYWCSWVCDNDDHRPVTYPPNEAILGWWCSGYDSQYNAILCALVQADSESLALSSVEQDWPEFDGNWRYIRETDTLLTDRFPLSDWMEPRVSAARAELQNATGEE